MHHPLCDECGTRLYQAGERVHAGTYLRVDDESFQRVRVSTGGGLPASFDGHIALYRAAAAPCVCERRQRERTSTPPADAARRRVPVPHATSPSSGSGQRR